jgi:phosphate starvation-inducible membrane PsiE
MNTHSHNKLVLKIAVSMVFVFVLVVALVNQPTFLIDWQRSKAYKEFTGYVLFVLMLSMWWIPLAPKFFVSSNHLKITKLLHQWCGALILLLILFHASFRKVGFLAGFTVLLLLGVVCAIAYRWIKGPRTTKTHKYLMGAHIGAAVAVSSMSLLHMYFIFAYTK